MFWHAGAAVVPLQSSGGGSGGILVTVVWLAVLVAVVAGTWKAFEKAGEPGWGAIVPVYNLYLMIKIGGNDWWWLLLLFVPVINFLVILKISVDVAKAFGQGLGFGLGLGLLSFVFWPLLGFGDYEYRGPPEEGTGPV
jgi:hypothetical protein